MTLPRALAPLRHRGFRLLAGGQMASNVGDAFYAVALPWYVLSHHGGALLLGAVLAAYGVPRTALLALGGHAADRFGPWNTMMVADALRAVAVGALALGAAAGPADVAVLVPIAAALGAGEGLFLPGSFAIVPSLLPDEDLQAGNALSAGGTQLAMLVGPALGGLAVAFAGAPAAFGVDAASFAASALTLFGVRACVRPPAQAPAAIPAAIEEVDAARANVPGRAATGPVTSVWRLVATERVVQVILLVMFVANLGFGGMSEVALPDLAHGPLHADAAGYGALLAAFGGGALLGTICAAQLHRARRPALLASMAFLAEAVFVSIAPFLGSVAAAAAALALFGALNGLGNVVAITVIQRWAPRHLLGRLMGLLMLAGVGIFPASVLLGGVAVRALGPAPFFPLAGGILALAVLAGLSQPSWRSFGEHAAAVDVQTAAGDDDVAHAPVEIAER